MQDMWSEKFMFCKVHVFETGWIFLFFCFKMTGTMPTWQTGHSNSTALRTLVSLLSFQLVWGFRFFFAKDFCCWGIWIMKSNLIQNILPPITLNKQNQSEPFPSEKCVNQLRNQQVFLFSCADLIALT